MQEISVVTPLPLGAFLKVAGAVRSGGEAKRAVQAGLVTVNGTVEVRRAHLLRSGDVVGVRDEEYRVCSSPA
jgi:ribosome-associated protein